MPSRRSILRAGAAVALAGTAAGAGLAPAFGATAAAGPWRKLRQQLQGELVLPADTTYAFARQMQFIEFDAVSPRAVAYCATPADVQACVRFAREHGIAVRTRSGGHNYQGWSTGEGLVVDLSRINHAHIGIDTVHIGPGLQGIDALTALGPRNIQLVTGTCPTVCAGGFLTGGGIGFQTRKFGLGLDRLESVTVVLADGRVVRASQHHEPELFWALRGAGGGNFGIVVDYETHPIDAPRMVPFNLSWSWDQAHAVFAAWQEWCLTGSENQGSALVCVLEDATEDAVPLVLVMGGYHGTQAEADASIAELVALVGTPPTFQSAVELPYDEGMKAAYGCGDITVPECHREGSNPAAQLHRTNVLREAYRFFGRKFTSSELAGILSAWSAERRPDSAGTCTACPSVAP